MRRESWTANGVAVHTEGMYRVQVGNSDSRTKVTPSEAEKGYHCTDHFVSCLSLISVLSVPYFDCMVEIDPQDREARPKWWMQWFPIFDYLGDWA